VEGSFHLLQWLCGHADGKWLHWSSAMYPWSLWQIANQYHLRSEKSATVNHPPPPYSGAYQKKHWGKPVGPHLMLIFNIFSSFLKDKLSLLWCAK
jgi:hypothetical protein